MRTLLLLCFLFTTSCASVRQLGTPVLICVILDKEPNSAPYFSAVSGLIEEFAKSEDLSPTSFALALQKIPLGGLKPLEVRAVAGLLASAYAEIYPSVKPDKLRPVLLELSASVALAVSQCSKPVDPVAASAPRITETSADTAFRTLARDLKTIAEK
jgi:hypothetical protein